MIDMPHSTQSPAYVAFMIELNRRARIANEENERIAGDWILPLLVVPQGDPLYGVDASGNKVWGIVDIIPSGPSWWRNKRIKALNLARKYQLKRQGGSFAYWMDRAVAARKMEKA